MAELSMHAATTIGFIAGTLTTLSFVPQVFKAWHTKRCQDLSWGMLITFSGGVTLWLAYGLLLRAAPIIAANAVTMALLITIGCLKLRYRNNEVGVAAASPKEIR
jgi:MtN3 and saliva related transmembrane protein